MEGVSGIGGTGGAWHPSLLKGPRTVDETARSGATGLTQGTGAADRPPEFSRLLNQFIEGVDQTQKASELETRKVLMGESTNLHQAMLAGEESGIAFRLLVETRNKLVEGFQEVMRMQV